MESGSTALQVFSVHTEEEKDSFWDPLHFRLIGFEEHTLISRDLNGHVSMAQDSYTQQHSSHWYGEWSNKASHDLDIVKTFYKRRTIHLVTYTSSSHANRLLTQPEVDSIAPS